MTRSHLRDDMAMPQQLDLGALDTALDSSTWLVSLTHKVVPLLVECLSTEGEQSSYVTFFAREGEVQLLPLIHTGGWMAIAKHILQTDDLCTEHYLLAGIDQSSNILGTTPCLQLISCKFEQHNTEPAPLNVCSALVQNLSTQDSASARSRHLQKLREKASLGTDTVESLTERLGELDEVIAKTRSDLRAFVNKSEEYLQLQDRLTSLLREDHAIFIKRRKLRSEHYDRLANPVATKSEPLPIAESVRHLATFRWRLEP